MSLLGEADRLTAKECSQLGNLALSLNCDAVRLYRRSTTGTAGLLRRMVLFLSRGRAVTLGNHVVLPHHCERDLPVLAHELTHCTQYQTWGPMVYYGRGIGAQLRDLLHRTLRIGSSPYSYRAELGKPFHEYGMEQQGQIVEDCFRGLPEAKALSPFQPGSSG
jgi:hypothetical protein